MEDCYVYAISDGDRHCKIGIASAPGLRLLALQSGNPRPLRIVRTLTFKSRKAALDAERFFLRAARRHAAIGEWLVVQPSAIERWFDATISKWHREWLTQS